MIFNMKGLVKFAENKKKNVRKLEDLPNDVIEEIILRLPTEKVSRIVPFMGLEHLSYLCLKNFEIQCNKKSSNCLLIDVETINLSRYNIYSGEREIIRVVDQSKNGAVDRIAVGSSNGLICDVTINFRLNEIVVQVMNPLLVTSVLVPHPTLPINVENLDVYGFGCMGFDFKIKRIVQSGETGVEVYRSLEGRWSQINVAWPVFSNVEIMTLSSEVMARLF